MKPTLAAGATATTRIEVDRDRTIDFTRASLTVSANDRALAHDPRQHSRFNSRWDISTRLQGRSRDR
jgi:hypothetical protein